MNHLRAVVNRLPLFSVRSRVLMIALLPALLAEFGMVAYFTSQSLADAEDALHARAASAARQLASALPYALASGDSARTTALLESEVGTNQLAFVRVTDAEGRLLAGSGSAASGGAARAHRHLQRNEIRLPAGGFRRHAICA